MAKRRKIIQVAFNPHVPYLDNDFAVLALCNDGSLWYGYIDGAFFRWKGAADDIPDAPGLFSQLAYRIRNLVRRIRNRDRRETSLDAEIPF